MPAKTEAMPAYPLQWPVSVPRTPSPERSKFSKRAWNQSIDDLRRELNLLGATNLVISTNQPIRQDGMPYAQARIGLPMGYSPQQPMCSVDAREARLPIKPVGAPMPPDLAGFSVRRVL